MATFPGQGKERLSVWPEERCQPTPYLRASVMAGLRKKPPSNRLSIPAFPPLRKAARLRTTPKSRENIRSGSPPPVSSNPSKFPPSIHGCCVEGNVRTRCSMKCYRYTEKEKEIQRISKVIHTVPKKRGSFSTILLAFQTQFQSLIFGIIHEIHLEM